MSNIDIISMAIRNLFKRKLRTFLTILGVIVGTGAIVIMISLGIAMNESFNTQLDQMGDLSLITVYDPSYWGGSSSTKDVELNKATCEEFKKIKGVKAVTPIAQAGFNFVSGKYEAYINVRGIDAAVMPELTFKLLDGRLLDEGDNESFNFVFGYDTAFDFMKPGPRNYYRYNGEEEPEPDVDVMNDKIKIKFGTENTSSPNDDDSEEKAKPAGKVKQYNINAVGRLSQEDYEGSYYAYVSLSQFEKMQALQKKYNKDSIYNRNQKQKSGYDQAFVKCNSIDDVSKIQEQIKEMGFDAESRMDYIKSMQEISNSLQGLLGAIGAVSLFIAAIGITNTMIMAIYERTREIGIMKVIGAQIKDIKKLFLLEAMLIGFLGGVFGILISLLVSVILNNFQIPFLTMMSWSEESKISSIPLWLCILALCFSTFVGLISGYFPARRAMKLSALSAIKTE